MDGDDKGKPKMETRKNTQHQHLAGPQEQCVYSFAWSYKLLLRAEQQEQSKEAKLFSFLLNTSLISYS